MNNLKTKGFASPETHGCTLLGHVQLFVPQHPQILLLRAALHPFHPPACADTGDCPDSGAGPLHLALLNFMRFTWAPFLQIVQVPLDGISSLRWVNRTTQRGVICSACKLGSLFHRFQSLFYSYHGKSLRLNDSSLFLPIFPSHSHF